MGEKEAGDGNGKRKVEWGMGEKETGDGNGKRK